MRESSEFQNNYSPDLQEDIMTSSSLSVVSGVYNLPCNRKFFPWLFLACNAIIPSLLLYLLTFLYFTSLCKFAYLPLKRVSKGIGTLNTRAGEPEPKPGVFGSLEPEPLEKKRSRSRLEKKVRSRSR